MLQILDLSLRGQGVLSEAQVDAALREVRLAFPTLPVIVLTASTGADAKMRALQLGATYVARGFSGDKAQLVPLIKGALRHGGAAFIDVISPCVTFNNHESSTKSYVATRRRDRALVEARKTPLPRAST